MIQEKKQKTFHSRSMKNYSKNRNFKIYNRKHTNKVPLTSQRKHEHKIELTCWASVDRYFLAQRNFVYAFTPYASVPCFWLWYVPSKSYNVLTPVNISDFCGHENDEWLFKLYIIYIILKFIMFKEIFPLLSPGFGMGDFRHPFITKYLLL